MSRERSAPGPPPRAVSRRERCFPPQAPWPRAPAAAGAAEQCAREREIHWLLLVRPKVAQKTGYFWSAARRPWWEPHAGGQPLGAPGGNRMLGVSRSSSLVGTACWGSAARRPWWRPGATAPAHLGYRTDSDTSITDSELNHFD